MHMPAQRDPASELFDAGARRLLSRAYANPGHWAGTRLADPGPRQESYLRAEGIDWRARDDVPGGRARTRWGRAFTRALYYQHKWWSGSGGRGWRTQKRTVARASGGLVVEVGAVKPAVGVIPRGRAVRVKLMPGGASKERAVSKMDETRRWADHGPAWADPARRDW